MKAVVGFRGRQRSRCREQLGVRRRDEELIGIQRVHRFPAFEIDNVNAPMRARKLRLAQQKLDLLGNVLLARRFFGRLSGKTDSQ